VAVIIQSAKITLEEVDTPVAEIEVGLLPESKLQLETEATRSGATEYETVPPVLPPVVVRLML
jgi:hypothetical protein